MKRLAAFLATALCAFLPYSHAIVFSTLLEVDLSVTNQITITATTETSAATETGNDSTGVYLAGFYNGTGSSFSGILDSGMLTSSQDTSDGSPGIFRFTDDPGLAIFSFTDTPTASFTAGQQAFTDFATWTVSPTQYTDMVNGNTSGALYFPADGVSDLPGPSQIGTWVVVPEPKFYGLLAGLVGFGLVWYRRRRLSA